MPQDFILRLPTEAEWEKAARGTDGLEWPWGNEFDKTKCNTKEGSKGSTTPVDYYVPRGESPYGCADMIGNAHEWTHSLYKHYPYRADDGREEKNDSSIDRVIRGGSFKSESKVARPTSRLIIEKPSDISAEAAMDSAKKYIGFRVVLAPRQS